MDPIRSVTDLDEQLSRPDEAVLRTLSGGTGDFLIAGAGGKMGPSLCRMMRRGLDAVGRQSSRVIAVSRFPSGRVAEELRVHGVETLSCDLLDRTALQSLPEVSNIIFMAGQKFGTQGNPEQTWAVNTLLPGLVADRFPRARFVVFSTGCVYPLTPISGVGSREDDPLVPPGEYAASCVGRERIFGYYSRLHGAEMLFFRLCYAIELRYGVLLDIAQRVYAGVPVDVRMGWTQVIWQRDACARAIRSFEYVSSPPTALNVTGVERLSVRWLGEEFGRRFGKPARFSGEEGAESWLWDAGRASACFGPPETSTVEMLDAVAWWVESGGSVFGKPTHFEVQDGNY